MNILVKAKVFFPTYFPTIINYSSGAHVLIVPTSDSYFAVGTEGLWPLGIHIASIPKSSPNQSGQIGTFRKYDLGTYGPSMIKSRRMGWN